jgi:hypothetical protein
MGQARGVQGLQQSEREQGCRQVPQVAILLTYCASSRIIRVYSIRVMQLLSVLQWACLYF